MKLGGHGSYILHTPCASHVDLKSEHNVRVFDICETFQVFMTSRSKFDLTVSFPGLAPYQTYYSSTLDIPINGMEKKAQLRISDSELEIWI